MPRPRNPVFEFGAAPCVTGDRADAPLRVATGAQAKRVARLRERLREERERYFEVLAARHEDEERMIDW